MTSYEKFEKARQLLENNFSDDINGKKYPKDWHQLSNGVWVFQSNSAKSHVNFCRRLLMAVGISESEWSVEEVKNTTLLTNSVDT